METIPTELKRLRACLLCSMIKTVNQFRRDGCENCEEALQMKGSMDRVMECTSSNFQGMIAMMDPRDSWVAKWQRIDRYQPGMYAMKVYGQLPEDIQAGPDD